MPGTPCIESPTRHEGVGWPPVPHHGDSRGFSTTTPIVSCRGLSKGSTPPLHKITTIQNVVPDLLVSWQQIVLSRASTRMVYRADVYLVQLQQISAFAKYRMRRESASLYSVHGPYIASSFSRLCICTMLMIFDKYRRSVA